MLFLKGLILGFCIAAPVGPIGVLCIQRTLARGRLVGFLTGLGAATADAFYGSLAALGFGAATRFLVANQAPIRVGGGLFLLYLAYAILRARSARSARSEAQEGPAVPVAGGAGKGSRGRAAAYGSAVLLTLTNPMTILSFAAIFAGVVPVSGGLGVTEAGSAVGTWGPATLVAGVFCGSAAWWLVLSTLTGAVRARLDATWLRRIDLLSAAVIASFALLAIVSGLRS